MGTSLTGLTPATTYDSLIKVTDNGPLSGTLKALSDGLGNDSTLSLSTTAASIAGTLAVAGVTTFSSNVGLANAFSLTGRNAANTLSISLISRNASDRVVIDPDGYGTNIGGGGTVLLNPTGGKVGINTSTASRVLTLKNNTGATNGISFQSSVSTSEIAAIECNQTLDTIDFEMSSNYAGHGFRFLTGAPTLFERARFTANGLCFNGDTLAANALDDYEEGTWTMGIAFGGASVGVTTSANTGAYTKIGRQVTVTGLINLTSKGSSTGSAKITGLPFTIAVSSTTYTASSFRINEITFANQFQGFGEPNTTNIVLEEVTEAGVNTSITDADFANSSDIMVSLTYFV